MLLFGEPVQSVLKRDFFLDLFGFVRHRLCGYFLAAVTDKLPLNQYGAVRQIRKGDEVALLPAEFHADGIRDGDSSFFA